MAAGVTSFGNLELIEVGTETTTIALTYMVYLLTKHPQYIEGLRGELAAYETIDDVSFSELEKLPLLNGVIRESLRLYPPGSGPLGRVCPPEGTILGSYLVKGGV